MYLVTLSGIRSRERIWNLDIMREILWKLGGYIIELTDDTTPDFSIEALKREQKDTLVGRFIIEMEKEKTELGELAMQYGLQALLARDERK